MRFSSWLSLFYKYSGLHLGRERLPRNYALHAKNLWSRFFPSLSLLKYVTLGRKKQPFCASEYGCLETEGPRIWPSRGPMQPLPSFGGWRCTQRSCSRLFVYLLLFASGPQAVFSYRLTSRAHACCDNTTALNKGGRRCVLNVEPIKDGGLRNTYVRCVSQTFVFDTERSDFSSFHSLNNHWFWVEIWSCNKCKYY